MSLSAKAPLEPPRCFEDYIVSELSCFNCKKRLSDTIFHCERGHSVCETCHKIGAICRGCGTRYCGTRTHHLERIYKLLTYPCKFYAAGCQRRVALRKLKSHEDECLTFKLQCPLRHIGNCAYVGNKAQIVFHCQLFHRKFTFVSDGRFKQNVLHWNFQTKLSPLAKDGVFQSDYLYYFRNTIFYGLTELDQTSIKLKFLQMGPSSESEFPHSFVIQFYSFNEELVDTSRGMCGYFHNDRSDWISFSLQILRRCKYFVVEFVEEFVVSV